MKVTLWQQFSSNHSSHFKTVVGRLMQRLKKLIKAARRDFVASSRNHGSMGTRTNPGSLEKREGYQEPDDCDSGRLKLFEQFFPDDKCQTRPDEQFVQKFNVRVGSPNRLAAGIDYDLADLVIQVVGLVILY